MVNKKYTCDAHCRLPYNSKLQTLTISTFFGPSYLIFQAFLERQFFSYYIVERRQTPRIHSIINTKISLKSSSKSGMKDLIVDLIDLIDVIKGASKKNCLF